MMKVVIVFFPSLWWCKSVCRSSNGGVGSEDLGGQRSRCSAAIAAKEKVLEEALLSQQPIRVLFQMLKDTLSRENG